MKKSVGIIMALVMSAMMVACGGKRDGVESVSTSAGYKCEVCGGLGQKVAAEYCVTQNGIDHYVCSIHKNSKWR